MTAVPSRIGELCVGVAERLVQRRPVDRQAAADTVPEPVDVDVGQPTTAVVEEALPPDRIGARRNGRSDAELTQSPNGIAGQVQAGAGRLPLGHALDDLELMSC